MPPRRLSPLSDFLRFSLWPMVFSFGLKLVLFVIVPVALLV